MSILEKIVDHKREELKEVISATPLMELKARIRDVPPTRDLAAALRDGPKGRVVFKIIAEIKKASPSRGVIREDFDPVSIAERYGENGAAALSVLTESRYFKGDIAFLPSIAERVGIPVLRKDFIFDEYQVYETRAFRGDAFLLIAAILSRERLRDLSALGMGLGMTPLVEVHNREELEKVSGLDLPVIGINNRDLTTFRTDLMTSVELARLIPRDVVKVSESGIKDREDLELLEKEGVDAFLVGEALLREEDVGTKLRNLCGFTP